LTLEGDIPGVDIPVEEELRIESDLHVFDTSIAHGITPPIVDLLCRHVFYIETGG